MLIDSELVITVRDADGVDSHEGLFLSTKLIQL